MALKFQIMPPDWRPPPDPEWYTEMLAKEAAFNALHPRCIGCGQFVKKNSNICSNCEDYSY